MSNIINCWPQSFRDLYGGEWPSCYATFDTETTGYDMERDVITEIAHCLVEDGEVTDRLSLVLDWTGHRILPDNWLRTRLDRLRSGMAQSGRICHMTYERMKSEGVPPEKALRHYRDLFRLMMERKIPVVAHNGYGFDEKMLKFNMAGFEVDHDFDFGPNGMLDTEGIEKASQITDHARVQVHDGDTLRSYFMRVNTTRVGNVRSNLDNHCYKRYGFDKLGIVREEMHGAATDAFCVHLLMEEYRKQISGAPPATPWLKGMLGTVPAAQLRQPSPPTRRRGQRNR